MISLSPVETATLYLAIGPAQLAALVRADYRCIEPGRDGERFLFFKLSQRYAEMIARQWELAAHGVGYVVEVRLPRSYLQRFELSTVAYEEHLEYRVPVAELPVLNRQLAVEVQVVTAFREHQGYSVPRGRLPSWDVFRGQFT